MVEPREGQNVPAGSIVGAFLDFPDACWQYLQSTLNESLTNADPFVSSLAVLNAKVGQQRLRRMATWDLHPLTRAMLDFRMQAERDARRRDGAERAALTKTLGQAEAHPQRSNN